MTREEYEMMDINKKQLFLTNYTVHRWFEEVDEEDVKDMTAALMFDTMFPSRVPFLTEIGYEFILYTVYPDENISPEDYCKQICIKAIEYTKKLSVSRCFQLRDIFSHFLMTEKLENILNFWNIYRRQDSTYTYLIDCIKENKATEYFSFRDVLLILKRLEDMIIWETFYPEEKT